MATNALQKLDNETRSKIRSTQILTSLPQIISELVQNSLDAGAKSIEIGVDMDEWACWVKDDGVGISKSDLELIAQGCERGRYATSKVYNSNSLDHVTTFGFRGEALASAADLSCLEISSRTPRSKESWSIIVRGGETLYYGPSMRWRKERAGTTVAIRDAFYNLPIRRLSHPNATRTIDIIRRDVETISLVFPSVSFSLEDSERDRRDGRSKSRILSIPKTYTMLKAFRHAYGRALVEHVDEMDEERNLLNIEGFISLVGSLSKVYQFLYVNRHILDNCNLHRVIDQKFAASSFAKNALDELGETGLPRPSTRRSPRKNERRPIYVLNITVPPCQLDNCLEPAKAAVGFQNQEAVVSFLADVIERFLVRHGFKKDKPDTASVVPAAKRRKLEAETGDVGGQSRIQTAKNSTPLKKIQEKEIYVQENLRPSKEGETTTWTDPSTGRAYIVDLRTGNSYPKGQQQGGDEESGALPRPSRRVLLDNKRLQSSQSSCTNNHGDEGTTVMPDWIKEALQCNTAFAPTERDIVNLPLSGLRIEEESQKDRFCTWHKRFDETLTAPELNSGRPITTPMSSFSRECIAHAQVIEQVDRKFIACLMDLPLPSNTSGTECPDNNALTMTSRTLVLVDQHAADERIRVERFLKSLCLGFFDRAGVGVERRMLNPPASVLLSTAERDRIKRSDTVKKAFRSWGFDICDDQGDSDPEQSYAVVNFSAVPEIVADKLLSGEDLPEFVKGFLARLEGGGLYDSAESQERYFNEISSTPATDGSEFAWLKALRLCPRELIELVNSKACRGAIMFNDQLTVEQCKRLMRQLSATAFPFQCAHGRPSIVPLTVLPAEANAVVTRPIDWSRLNDDD